MQSEKYSELGARTGRAFRCVLRVVFPLTVSWYARPSAYSICGIDVQICPLVPTIRYERHVSRVETGHKRGDTLTVEPEQARRSIRRSPRRSSAPR